MNELEKLSNGLSNFKQKNELIRACKDEILSGNTDPLKVEIYLKNIADVVDKIRKDPEVKEYIIQEAEKYGKSFTHLNAKIEVSSKKTYCYDKCGDTLYNKTKIWLKEREEWLKTMKPDMIVFDEGTGERLNPATFTTSQFLKIVQK